MNNILLYFGSFNPPHKGHTAIARYIVESGICDELWIVVSPQNPMKSSNNIVCKEDRAEMVELALKEEGLATCVKVCLIEFDLPTPSYTVDTLKELSTRFPTDTFSILIGGDNQCEFEKWKEWDYIADNYDMYVYPRPGAACGMQYKRLKIMNNAPLMECNSTEIRQSLTSGIDEHKWLHTNVLKYIKDRGIWI